MAGAGWKDFVPGQVLSAANVQDYLQDQSVMVFASAAARTSALASPSEGMVSYLKNSNLVEVHDGSAWKQLGATTGGVLKVVSASSTTSTTTTSTTFVSAGLTATITPSSSSSKILILCHTNAAAFNGSTTGTFTLFRGTVSGTNLGNGNNGMATQTYQSVISTISLSYLDSPATTSAQTYTLGMRAAGAVTVEAQNSSAKASMTLIEVAG